MNLLFLTIIAAALLIYAHKQSNKNKSTQPKDEQQPPQPAHFALMDEEGNPIKSEYSSASVPGDSSSVTEAKDVSVQHLRYFCIKDKGYHVSVWPKDQGFQGVDYVEFNIAGITHGEYVDDHLGEFAATLEPDPTNPYDQKAIKIVTREGHRVGYVPKDMTSDVRNFASLPCRCYCYIGQNDGMYFTDCYITNKDK